MVMKTIIIILITIIITLGNKLTKQEDEYLKDWENKKNTPSIIIDSIIPDTTTYGWDKVYNYVLISDSIQRIIDSLDKKTIILYELMYKSSKYFRTLNDLSLSDQKRYFDYLLKYKKIDTLRIYIALDILIRILEYEYNISIIIMENQTGNAKARSFLHVKARENDLIIMKKYKNYLRREK